MDQQLLRQMSTLSVESDNVITSDSVSRIQQAANDLLARGLEKFHLDSMDNDECSMKPRKMLEEYAGARKMPAAKRNWQYLHLYGDDDLDLETIKEIGRENGAIPRRFLRKIYGMKKKSPRRAKISSNDNSDWNSLDDTSNICSDEELQIKNVAKHKKPLLIYIENQTYRPTYKTIVLPENKKQVTIHLGKLITPETTKKSNVMKIINKDLIECMVGATSLNYYDSDEKSEPDEPPASRRSWNYK